MDKRMIASALALVALGATGAQAQDRATAKVLSAAMPAKAGERWGVETIAIDIRASGDRLWSGTLRLGGQYGNASFNQSKNEYAEPCPAKPMPNANASSNRQLNFSISRRNPQQGGNLFYINLNWTQPLAACEGGGSNSFGFNRVIEISPGGTATIEGAGGMVVRLTRQG